MRPGRRVAKRKQKSSPNESLVVGDARAFRRTRRRNGRPACVGGWWGVRVILLPGSRCGAVDGSVVFVPVHACVRACRFSAGRVSSVRRKRLCGRRARTTRKLSVSRVRAPSFFPDRKSTVRRARGRRRSRARSRRGDGDGSAARARGRVSARTHTKAPAETRSERRKPAAARRPTPSILFLRAARARPAPGAAERENAAVPDLLSPRGRGSSLLFLRAPVFYIAPRDQSNYTGPRAPKSTSPPLPRTRKSLFIRRSIFFFLRLTRGPGRPLVFSCFSLGLPPPSPPTPSLTKSERNRLTRCERPSFKPIGLSVGRLNVKSCFFFRFVSRRAFKRSKCAARQRCGQKQDRRQTVCLKLKKN